MGLDMYLKAEKNVSDYTFENGKNRDSIDSIMKAIGFTGDDLSKDSPILTVTFNAMYWRKANQIHQWFVDNTQEQVDRYGDYSVSREQLQELVRLCKEVMDNHDKAEEILPTSEGFFFGSTVYDKWYFEQVEDTYNELSRLLSDERYEGCYFSYISSW